MHRQSTIVIGHLNTKGGFDCESGVLPLSYRACVTIHVTTKHLKWIDNKEQLAMCYRLKTCVTVGVGYVTGANHLEHNAT